LNDAVVGGHNMIDREAAKLTGRVYRVAPPGSNLHFEVRPPDRRGLRAGVAIPEPFHPLSRLDDAAKDGPDGKKELVKLWSHGTDPRLRARALYLLAQLKGSEAHYIKLALKDLNPNLRITGLRIARERKLDVIPYVKMLPQRSVPAGPPRMRHCLAPQRLTGSAQPLACLAEQHDGEDRCISKPSASARTSRKISFSKPGWRWSATIGTLPPAATSSGARVSVKAPALLGENHRGQNTPDPERARYFRALDFIKGPEAQAALIQLLGLTTTPR